MPSLYFFPVKELYDYPSCAATVGCDGKYFSNMSIPQEEPTVNSTVHYSWQGSLFTNMSLFNGLFDGTLLVAFDTEIGITDIQGIHSIYVTGPFF